LLNFVVSARTASRPRTAVAFAQEADATRMSTRVVISSLLRRKHDADTAIAAASM